MARLPFPLAFVIGDVDVDLFSMPVFVVDECIVAWLEDVQDHRFHRRAGAAPLADRQGKLNEGFGQGHLLPKIHPLEDRQRPPKEKDRDDGLGHASHHGFYFLQGNGGFKAPPRKPSIQRPHFQKENGETDHEDQPSGKVVKDPFRHAGAPDRVENPDGRKAQAVGYDRHRYRRKDKDRTFPERKPVMVREQEPERHQGNEVAQAAACVHHLQLGKAQVDDVPFPVGAHPEELQHMHTDPGGEELQLQGDIAVDEIRRREHHEQEGQGKGDDLQFSPTEMQPTKTDHNQPERQEQRGVFPPQFAQHVKTDSRPERKEPSPGGFRRNSLQLIPFIPEEVEDYRGNNVAVGEVFPLPHSEQGVNRRTV